MTINFWILFGIIGKPSLCTFKDTPSFVNYDTMWCADVAITEARQPGIWETGEPLWFLLFLQSLVETKSYQLCHSKNQQEAIQSGHKYRFFSFIICFQLDFVTSTNFIQWSSNFIFWRGEIYFANPGGFFPLRSFLSCGCEVEKKY